MALTADKIARLNAMCPAAETAALGTEINNAVSGVVDENSIGDLEIDWGTGATQVSGADVPLADAATYFTTDTVEAALAQIMAERAQVGDGVAGADYVGATAISGWSGGDVQTILESAKVVVDNVTARVNDDLRMPLVLGGTLGSDVGLGGTLVGLPAATDPGTATILPAVFGWDNGEAADSQAVDYTAEAASAGADDVLVFPAVATIEDAFHISAVEKFHAVLVDIGVQADMAVTTVWEYSDNAGDATSFTAIPAATMADATTAMQVAGTSTYLITFVPPTDWAAIIPSGETDDVVLKDVARYTIRCRISAFTSTTTEPVVTQVWTYHLSTMAGIPAPVTGSVASIMFNFNTASGSTGDSYFLLGNVTQGTYQSYTKTKATVFEIVAGVLAVTEGDELVLMQVAEDGSTEFADGSGTLLITPTAVS